jgi:hypothetical protein
MRRKKSNIFRFTHSKCMLCQKLVAEPGDREEDTKIVRYAPCQECIEKHKKEAVLFAKTEEGAPSNKEGESNARNDKQRVQ